MLNAIQKRCLIIFLFLHVNVRATLSSSFLVSLVPSGLSAGLDADTSYRHLPFPLQHTALGDVGTRCKYGFPLPAPLSNVISVQRD